MSDPAQPPPPKPKPGSLRDRIAAFEKPASSTSSAPKPPPIRPKPGNVSWKPAPPSPTANTTANVTPESDEKKPGGMSATDAKESIGKGGSLKERMAALQGRGAFGAGSSPSPPPVGPKPSKRPPLVVPPPPVEGSDSKELGETKSTEKPEDEKHAEKEDVVEPVGDSEATPKEKEDPVEEEQNEEVKERERRAAIAARMARLGGARVGMSPPIFGKKPEVKEKPKDVPAPEDQPKEMASPKEATPPIAAETEADAVQGDFNGPSVIGATSISNVEETTTSPEAKEISTQVPGIVTDEEVISKDTIGELGPSPTSPSGSRPSLGSTSSQTSLTSSRSPPMSMPIPAVPRRAGPPPRRSARNIKAEAKKQDQESAQVPALPSETLAEPIETTSKPIEVEYERSIPGEEEITEDNPKSTSEHDAVELQEATSPAGERAVASSEDTNDHVAPQSLIQDAQEDEAAPEIPILPEDSFDEHPTEIAIDVPAVQEADALPSSEPTIEAIPPSVEVDTPEPVESAFEAKELEDATHPAQEPELPGLSKPELLVSDRHPPEEDVVSPSHDAEDKTPADPSPEPSAVAESGPPAPESVGHEVDELVTEVATAQEPEQPKAAAGGDETEDEEATRRKRIAERMAKMGGRNPFATGPFGAAPPRKVSGDEPQAPPSIPATEEPSHIEKENEDIVPEREAVEETVVDIESHEAEDPGPRVMGVEQEQDDELPPVEDTLEEHEATESEHKTTPQVLSSSEPEEHPDTASPAEEPLSTEEAEMAPPRITRAVPPPPPQAPLEEPAMSPVRKESIRSSHMRSLPPPPEESTYPGARDEEEGVSEEYNMISELTDMAAPAPDPISVSSPKSDEIGETDQVSPISSPASRRSMPPPPRAAPAVPPATGSPEIRSPISPASSRKSIPPPPRTVPAPPGGDDPTDSEASASPVSVRRAASPPARAPPVPQTVRRLSREVESAVSPSASVGRSMPPPPKRVPSQPAEEPIQPPPRPPPPPAAEAPPPTPRRAPSYPTEEADIEPINRDSIDEQEVLADSEPDPIDPSFYSPPRSPATSSSPRDQQQHPSFTFNTSPASDDTSEADAEQARRRTIAERMAKLGGLRFGAPPPISRKPPAPSPENPHTVDKTVPETQEQGVGSEALDNEPLEPEEPEELDPEETERARRQAIAARLAGMGGMRFGMLPQVSAPAPAHPRVRSDDSARTVELASPPPQQAQPPPPAPPPAESIASEGDLQSEGVSDEGVKVEAESETSMEEVNAEDAEEEPEEIPPPVPSRPSRQSYVPTPEVAPPLPGGRRPPVPTSALPTRPPIPKVEPKRSSTSGSSRRASGPPGASLLPSNDFVMVDDPTPVEEIPPPPPSRTRPPRSMPPAAPPPPAPTSVPPSKNASSPWELPDIPSGSFDLKVGGGGGGLSMDSSITSEDSTTYPTTPSASSHARAPETTPIPTAPHVEVQLSADELLQLWGVVGIAVHAAASALFDKSKKSVVGDGTSQGFVNAALAQVPQASKVSYGHLIYSQTGNSVLRRSSNIMPGDIVQLTEAKLKGHKGLQSYHQSAGTAQEPLVGIVSEFETKKSKVKVYQANQHVGAQTVETASYRLEDIKSGSVKIFRVASA